MKVLPSSVAEVAIHGCDSPEFHAALPGILGRAPRALLDPALPFSVIVFNKSAMAVALLGVRFDMTGPKGTQYSVVHYADTLRNPEKADFLPGSARFICAEPAYTSLVMRGDAAADTRGRMNLDNLRRMLRIRASLDCIAFADGRFDGPDTQGAFDRFARDRVIETELVDRVANLPVEGAEAALYEAVQDPDERARRSAARKLLQGITAGGHEEMLNRARAYRYRIPLYRA